MWENVTDGLLVLQEFRLHAADSAGLVERVVASGRSLDRSAVPLLVSVDDKRDVAILRNTWDLDGSAGDRAERSALAPLVATWQSPRWYRSRIAERGNELPDSYRMAVSDEGISGLEGDPIAPRPHADGTSAASRVGLLWVGAPVGTRSGLLVLVGEYRGTPLAVGAGTSGWPLPPGRRRGVRIYVTAGGKMSSHGEAVLVRTN